MTAKSGEENFVGARVGDCQESPVNVEMIGLIEASNKNICIAAFDAADMIIVFVGKEEFVAPPGYAGVRRLEQGSNVLDVAPPFEPARRDSLPE